MKRRTHRSRYSLNTQYTFSNGGVEQAGTVELQRGRRSPMNTLSAREVEFLAVLDNFEMVRKNRASLAEILRTQIPERLLGRVWKELLQVRQCMGKNPGVYEMLLTKKSEAEESIVKDIARTFPKLLNDQDGQSSLFNILKAYSVFDPDLGYCQGMNYIAATLNKEMREEESFWALTQIIRKFQLRKMFVEDVSDLRRTLYVFDRCIEVFMPPLFSHFKSERVTPIMFASEWFSTLFVYNIDPALTRAIWTILFNEETKEGRTWLLKVSLAILKIKESSLMGKSFEEVVTDVKETAGQLKPSKVISEADRFELKPSLMARFQREFEHETTGKHL